MDKTTKGLTANGLKMIAIFAMLIDHAADGFVPAASPVGIALHFIGRLTAPLMCFFIAEGYYHTRDVRKYAIRLAIFAAISQFPYLYLFENGKVTLLPIQLNMIFTLLCGLLALWAWDKIRNIRLRNFVILAMFIATVPSDWQIFGVLFVLVFGIYHGDRKKQLTAFAIAVAAKLAYNIIIGLFVQDNLLINISRLGMFCAIPLLLLYNGQRGGFKGSKWLFYIIYPAHMLLFGLINVFFIQ